MKTFFYIIICIFIHFVLSLSASAKARISTPFKSIIICENVQKIVSTPQNKFFIPLNYWIRSSCFTINNASYYVIYSFGEHLDNVVLSYKKQNNIVIFNNKLVPELQQFLHHIIYKYVKISEEKNIPFVEYKRILDTKLNMYDTKKLSLTGKNIITYLKNKLNTISNNSKKNSYIFQPQLQNNIVSVRQPAWIINPFIVVKPESNTYVSSVPKNYDTINFYGQRKFLTIHESSLKKWYWFNKLLPKLYPEYKKVVHSILDWNILSTNDKKTTLYWDELQLKDYNWTIIDNVSDRIYKSKKNSTIFEWHWSQISWIYTTYVPICIEKPLMSYPKACLKKGKRNLIIQKSSVYSQRFRASKLGVTEGATRFFSPDYDEIYSYDWEKMVTEGSVQGYVINIEEYTNDAIVTKVSEMSVSRIPWDFSFETSCRTNDLTAEWLELYIHKVGEKKGNCYLNDWEMYYFNSRAIDIDEKNNIVEAASCWKTEYCVITMGLYSRENERFPISNLTKDYTK